MDRIKYVVVTDKSIRLLVKNQYTSNVESGSTRTEIKHWVELFFDVKVIAMNSHRLPENGVACARWKNGDIFYVIHNMWKYRRNFIEPFGLNAT
ncbi:hypothetical protein Goshw_017338 [Gossypium schwendimanii]|uniref:Ribosomal protein L23 n=1 Tax=Gossypium schwendimanii TaxID=34291 RepID=A0A7J9MTU8_GOSSC|nr:hypothetical protein [Gossypium schwendimanii]